MALTKHHDLINTDYFSNILYIRELEMVLKRKLTKIEKNIIEDTFRTIIKINNEWSNYSNKTDESFAKNKLELETYIKKYERTIKKSPDTYCIELYNKCELWLDEMEEIERRNLDKKCNSIKSQITQVLDELDSINFDYDFNGHFYYKRNPSNKSKRHYVSLLDEGYVWRNFAEEFNKKHLHIQLNTSSRDINGEMLIRALFKIYADLSLLLKNEEYNQCLKEIISLTIKNVCVPIKNDNNLSMARDNLEEIAYMIINKEYENAYQKTIDFINDNKKWYARAS